MLVSSLTPLSLTASVNLSRLREALRDLENNYDFFVDDGSWCCTTCANSNAWSEGEGKPFVFWHEQNEDSLHTDKSFEMPIHFGIASDMANLEEIGEVAKTIISVLEKLGEEIKSKKLDNALKVDSPTIADSLEKVKAFVESAKSNNEEGVVIKNGDAIYSEGRPSSGGNALKLKFVESATLRVSSITEGKRYVSIEINDNGIWISVGKCTVPANQDIPNPGELIEVDYLYAIKDGALFQPIYKGKRPDLDETAAVISQLKYKK